MHKKLEAELTSLAHSILQMKNKDDVFALQKKAHEVYEKLSVLAYVEEYINNTPNPARTKEELIALVEEAEEKKNEVVEDVVEVVREEEVIEETIAEEIDLVVENTIEEVKVNTESNPNEENKTSEPEEEVIKHDLEEETEQETIELELEEVEVTDEVEQVEEGTQEIDNTEEIVEHIETPVEKVEETIELLEEESVEEESIEEEVEDLFTIEDKKPPTLEEELQDTIAVDVVADLFENAPKKSLNDKLQGDIQIGLNDRIAFVKHLFGGSQEDFNRVISQLNTFKTEKEARKFINKMVKPDYDWTEKEEFEDRFMTIIERKFA